MATKKALKIASKKMEEMEGDLRFAETYVFVDGENARVTAKSELDKRYMPNVKTGDKRFKINKI